jgi:hypothetical protein
MRAAATAGACAHQHGPSDAACPVCAVQVQHDLEPSDAGLMYSCFRSDHHVRLPQAVVHCPVVDVPQSHGALHAAHIVAQCWGWAVLPTTVQNRAQR